MSSASDQVTDQVSPSSAPTMPAEAVDGPAKQALGLWDAVSIIVGIVVGAGIYQTAPTILFMSGSAVVALIAWTLGGVVSFIGAMCYAELASTYPRDGGDIIYLSRAFGRWCGFLFGWVQLTVILTGSIGAMAFVFSNYAIRLCNDALGTTMGAYTAFVFAGGAILILTLTNIIGVVVGKTVQNVLTVAKIIGLVVIIVAGFMKPMPDAFVIPENTNYFPPLIGIALVLVLYTYGGWNDAAFVAAEVQNGKQNITRSLLLGILIITLLYVLVNVAYISALGYSGAAGSGQIAADVLNKWLGQGGVTLMCVLVIVSSLGAVNGLIFTGARIYATIGQDYPILGWMSGWSREGATPVPALITQGVLAMGLVFLVGTDLGRYGINWALDRTALRSVEKPVLLDDGTETTQPMPDGHVLAPIAWDSTPAKILQGLAEKEAIQQKRAIFNSTIEELKKKDAFPERAEPLAAHLVSKGLLSQAKADELLAQVQTGDATNNLAKSGFETLVTCTAPIFWVFFLLTGLSLFVLRERDRDIERPFKVPLYPTLPLIFCLSCAYMLYSSIDYAFFMRWKGGLVLLGLLPVLIGLPLYHLSGATEEEKEATPPAKEG